MEFAYRVRGEMGRQPGPGPEVFGDVQDEHQRHRRRRTVSRGGRHRISRPDGQHRFRTEVHR